MSLEAHKEVFAKVLGILKKEGLLRGKKMGLDTSNFEANAAIRFIRRKIDAKRYEAYLKALVPQSGLEEPELPPLFVPPPELDSSTQLTPFVLLSSIPQLIYSSIILVPQHHS